MENQNKFTLIFTFMFVPIAIAMLIGIFFSPLVVANVYFVAAILCVVLVLMNIRASGFKTNYKLTFFFIDLTTAVAVAAIIYYEYSVHTNLLNILLMCLGAIELALICIDLFVIKSRNFTNIESEIINIFKLGTMICILTYFYSVSSLWFAVDAIIFEVCQIFLKIYFNVVKLGRKQEIKKRTVKEKFSKLVEIRISRAEREQGDANE
ncbi:MAG: hypothetical protein IJ538_04485 [Clostridia bacterium]|nr:hypothetical protein [Clostridia bacterium]